MRAPRLRHFVLLPYLVLWALAAPARAGEIVVLVHGYLGDADSWDHARIVPALQAAGWEPAGIWQSTPRGVQLVAEPGASAAGLLYRVNLPSTAPLGVQAGYLAGMLQGIERRHPGVGIDLVGHSAGGVVARLALVRYGTNGVERLITIAAPHLGTERAWQALDAADDSGLFGSLKRWFVQREVGDDLYRTVQESRGALVDLSPPVPGSLLYWLNSQRHPDIAYVSIVRGAGFGMPGDRVVPAPSQDMNRVPALRGRATTLVAGSDHRLQPADAPLLVELLAAKLSAPTR
jgi:triacylglycerol lipase